MKKKCALVIIFGLVLTIFGASDLFSFQHNASEVIIEFNGFNITLQEAIDKGYLVQGYSGVPPSSNAVIPPVYHLGSNIFVSVDGTEDNLQNFIDGSGLCGTIDSDYTSDIFFGHKGSEISISGIPGSSTLQDLINNGHFCCTPATCASLGVTCGMHSDGCGGIIDCGPCCTPTPLACDGKDNDCDGLVDEIEATGVMQCENLIHGGYGIYINLGIGFGTPVCNNKEIRHWTCKAGTNHCWCTSDYGYSCSQWISESECKSWCESTLDSLGVNTGSCAYYIVTYPITYPACIIAYPITSGATCYKFPYASSTMHVGDCTRTNICG